MAEYLAPGVYVEEFEAGAKPREVVGTSTAGFIGMAEKGPAEGIPQLVTNFADFERIYGGYLSDSEYGNYRFLAYAVEHFFLNGGSRCFISRVAPSDAKCAKGVVPAEGEAVIKLEAKNPGMWGNNLSLILSPASKAKTQIFEVLETLEGKRYIVKSGRGFFAGDIVAFSDRFHVIYNKVIKSQDNVITFAEEFTEDVTDKNLLPEKVISTCEFNMEVRYEDLVETYDNLSFNTGISNFVDKKLAKSDLINVSYAGTEPETATPPFARLGAGEGAVISVNFSEGSNGDVAGMSASDFIGVDNGAGKRSGIQAFLDNVFVSIIAAPGITDPKVQLSLVAHCEKLASRFAVLDTPRDAKKVQDIINHRNMFDSTYAALYHPWLMVFDPLDKRDFAIPPSGSMLGIYARTDDTRGVHKAPANEVVSACVGLDILFNQEEQYILNPMGVNLIRKIPDLGIRVCGARTVSSDGSWKYINARRLLIFIEETIKANTRWVIFEPNDEHLWLRVQGTIEVFLTNLWRGGSLAGSSPTEAFFVKIGRTTMTQDDIDKGRLICVIGVAPVKSAEFVTFRITQETGDASDLI